jgi:hypothetical protein
MKKAATNALFINWGLKSPYDVMLSRSAAAIIIGKKSPRV